MSEIIDLKRRNFLKGSATAAAAAGLVTTSAFASGYEDAKELKQEKEEDIKNAKYTPSICGMCVNMCGVIARTVDGKVTKIDPNPLYTKSRNFMCARGQSGIAEENDPDRITTPLIRVGEKGSGKFRKASWDEALDYIAKKMAKILDEEKDNRSTFAFGAGASTGNMGDPIFMNLIKGVGSENFVDHFSTCFAPSSQANKDVFGKWGNGDFQRTKYLLNLGANRAEGIVTPDTLDMFRRTHGRGLEKVVYIDPRYTNTASHSDEFIPIKPGTDLALMLAMIYETINNDYHKTPYKKEYIKKYVNGIEELEEYFKNGEGKQYTPEWAEKITEIPASTIKRLTKEFADAAEKYKGAANCYRSRKSTWYYQDYEFRRAQAMFNAIHGTINRPGGILLGRGIKKIESYEYEDFPFYDNPKPRIDISIIKDGEYPLANRGKGTWQVFRDGVLDINTRWRKGEKLAENEYPVRGMFIYKQNPMQSVPDYYKTAEMFKSMDLVVTIDIIVNDTALFSDVILPDTTYLERESLVKQFGISEPVIAWRSAAQKPAGEAKHIHFISKEIAKRIEKPFAAITFKNTWDEDDMGVALPKDFDLSKYLTDEFEIDEDKLKADIKDENLVEAILSHANDDMEIESFKISKAFDRSVSEFNEEVMTETFGKEAAEIAKEYGAYWPGIEDAIKDGVIEEHYKKVNFDKLKEVISKLEPKKKEELKTVLGKDYADVGNATYAIYKIYSKLPEDWYINPKNGKFINVTLNDKEGKKFKNPITGKTETMKKFPVWRDSLFKEPKTDKGELRVVLGRHAYFTQSANVNNYLLLDLMNYNYVWINDEFAKEHGLKFKDEVILTNSTGREVKAKVFPTKRIRKDTAYIATGFGSKSNLITLGENNGISQAEICENSIDPFIGSASMNETIIKIRKV